jgi:hypothetical protein
LKDIKIKLQTFLILELDDNKERVSRSGCFASWKEPTLNMDGRLGEHQSYSGYSGDDE